MPNIVSKSNAQKTAEAEVEGFRRDLGPFVVAAESTRMPMVFTDARKTENPIIFANDSFLALTGYAREEVLGQNFSFIAGADAELKALTDLAAALAESSEASLDLPCRRKDGARFWAAIFINPVLNHGGRTVEHFVSFVDLTRHKQEEERLHFLLDELNHRTHNTLATVQAIASQTLRGAASAAVIDAFEARILALSKAHNLLGRHNWDVICLHELLERILQPFGLDDPPASRIIVEGDDVRLPPKVALSLAMAFHELATNAAKYGALRGGPDGRITIVGALVTAAAGDRMRLSWSETGGPPVEPPTRRGFGSRLIERGLAQDLDGEVSMDYAPGGLVCRITMPLLLGRGGC
ncbi:MAG: signal transduction histidine kinase [Caulobacter sp.]|nr:signal transduction histidine kinase [Caulobacter sp.]